MAGMTVPTVAPSSAPLPTQQVNAPAGAFGASVVGAGLEGLGSSAQATSDALAAHAEQFQAINNKIASDNAGNQAIPAFDQARAQFESDNIGVYSDGPNKGQVKATANLPAFYSQLEDIRSKAAEGLSPAALVEFNSQSRRYIASTQSSATTFAVAQRKTSLIKGIDANADMAVHNYVTNSDDPDAEQNLGEVLGNNALTMQKEQGWTEDQTHLWMQSKTSTAYVNVAKQALDNGDLAKYQSIVQNHSGDMTTEALSSIMGAGKTASQANQFQGEARGIVFGGATPGSPAPTAPWDAGTKLLTKDPATALQSLVGVPVTVTSGARSAADNASVGGSPTSEHLTGNAWDFVPQGGNLQAAATSLAQGLHAQGIPFDQIEVDSANGHVHVGFGAQNRNAVIDQNGKALATTTPSVTYPPMQPPSPSTDVEQYKADTLARIMQQSEALHPNDIAAQHGVQSAAIAQMNVVVQQLNAAQGAAFDQLQGTILKGNIADISQLQAANPTAWSQIPPKLQHSLTQQVRVDANVVTPSRAANAEWLDGAYAHASTDPTTFLNADIRGSDLTMTQQQHYLKLQDQVQNRAVSDNIVANTLKSPQGQAALNSINVTKSADPTGYFQFSGALQAQVDNFRANNGGKSPQPKDMDTIIAQVTAQKGRGLFGGPSGPRNFQVPSDAANAIKAAAAAKGLNYSDLDVARVYQKSQIGAK